MQVPLYSNVQYRLPVDMGGGSNDVDVLLRSKNQILSIECKSGFLLGDHGPRALARVVGNVRRIESVLREMQIQLRRTYLLVHVGDDNEAVRTQLPQVDDVDIEVVKAGDLRPFLQRLAGNPTDS